MLLLNLASGSCCQRVILHPSDSSTPSSWAILSYSLTATWGHNVEFGGTNSPIGVILIEGLIVRQSHTVQVPRVVVRNPEQRLNYDQRKKSEPQHAVTSSPMLYGGVFAQLWCARGLLGSRDIRRYDPSETLDHILYWRLLL